MKKNNNEVSDLKIVLVHDFLREYGGAERVLETLHEMYPQAPVYVAFLDKKALGIHWQRFADWDIRETWFAKLPFARKIYSPLRFFAPHAFKSLNLAEYDVVISSSNAFEAKAVRAPRGVHICYCHTPPRALYGYSTMSSWKKNPLFKFFGEIINHYMRMEDWYAAQKVDHFIANSTETQRRIAKFYRRESTVIFPPVHMAKKEKSTTAKRSYYFYLNRLGLQKHPELALAACNQLGVQLKLAGSGAMENQLRATAGPTVEVLGAVSDDQLVELFAGAKALLYPVENEDFGMIPIEAMSHGVPVIAHRSGGPMETIVEGKTGLFFEELSVEAMAAAIKRASKMSFDSASIRRHAQKFSKENFIAQLQKLVSQVATPAKQ
jgi:glycosyltransferase involved in cell wall biosynthesis